MHVLVRPFSKNYLIARVKPRIINCIRNSNWITQHQLLPGKRSLLHCVLPTAVPPHEMQRKLSRSAQSLVWTARVQFGNPACRVELRQGGHERPAGETRPPFGVNLWACKLFFLKFICLP